MSMLRSAGVPNFAMSLFLTLTSGTPGSLMTVVVGEVLTTVLPGANVSQSPCSSFFDHFKTFRANLSSKDRSVRGMGLFNLGCIINCEIDLFFPIVPSACVHLGFSHSILNKDVTAVTSHPAVVIKIVLYGNCVSV